MKNAPIFIILLILNSGLGSIEALANSAPEAKIAAHISSAASGKTQLIELESLNLPWTKDIPADIARNYLNTAPILNERADNWLPTLRAIMLPEVKNCKSAEEAALLISPRMGELTGVKYSTKRSHPCLSPLQSLKEKKASCTGLSILFCASLRSIGIPSRIAGVYSWNHLVGNHTWTEVWIDGEWKMLEMNEKAYNTGWVMDSVGMLNPKQLSQRIMATTGKKSNEKNMYFPTPWAIHDRSIGASDESARYTALAKEWYRKNALPENTQALLIDISPRPSSPIIFELIDENGKVIDKGPSPSPEDDMRKMLKLKLPTGDKDKEYSLRLPSGQCIPLRATESPAQIIRLSKRKI